MNQEFGGMLSESFSCDSGEQMIAKQPLRKLQFAVNRISKVVSLHLKMLRNQRTNIEKFKQMEQWDKLHSELINASRTVQQLKADMYELEIVGQQVVYEDLSTFEEDSRKTQTEILVEVASFMEIHSQAMQPGSSFEGFVSEANHPKTYLTTMSVDYSSPSYSNQNTHIFGVEGGLQELRDCDKTMSLDAGINQTSKADSALNSWLYLNKELLDLRSTIGSFANLVKSQKPVLDNIENNIDETHQNVDEGRSHLSKAEKLKLAMMPVTGAVVGGLIGGPIGLIAGFKVGGMACLAGGSLGFMGVRYLEKRKRQNSEDLELKDLKSTLRTTVSLNNLDKNT